MSQNQDSLAIPNHNELTFAPEGRQVTSLDLSSPRGKRLFVNAMNAECRKISEFIGETINVCDALAHEVTLVSERNGEVSVCIRLVVIDTDGVCYQCVSTGAWESLRRLTVMTGPLPWPDGVPLVPRQRNTSGGRRMFYFDFHTDDEVENENVKPARRKKGE